MRLRVGTSSFGPKMSQYAEGKRNILSPVKLIPRGNESSNVWLTEEKRKKKNLRRLKW